MRVEIYQSEDEQIHVVLHGEAGGAVHFRDFGTFASFIAECHQFLEGSHDLAEAREGICSLGTPIPEPFLDAFGED